MIVRNVNICVRGFFSQNTLQFFKVSRFCLVVEGIEMYLVKKKNNRNKTCAGPFFCSLILLYYLVAVYPCLSSIFTRFLGNFIVHELSFIAGVYM